MAGGRPEIVKGSDRTLPLTIRKPNGDPFDLTAVTEITALFKKPDGTWLEVTKTGGQITLTEDALLGKIEVALTDSNTSEIEAGIKVSFKVYLDQGAHPGGTRRIVWFNQQIDVIDAD